MMTGDSTPTAIEVTTNGSASTVVSLGDSSITSHRSICVLSDMEETASFQSRSSGFDSRARYHQHKDTDSLLYSDDDDDDDDDTLGDITQSTRSGQSWWDAQEGDETEDDAIFF